MHSRDASEAQALPVGPWHFGCPADYARMVSFLARQINKHRNNPPVVAQFADDLARTLEGWRSDYPQPLTS